MFSMQIDSIAKVPASRVEIQTQILEYNARSICQAFSWDREPQSDFERARFSLWVDFEALSILHDNARLFFGTTEDVAFNLVLFRFDEEVLTVNLTYHELMLLPSFVDDNVEEVANVVYEPEKCTV